MHLLAIGSLNVSWLIMGLLHLDLSGNEGPLCLCEAVYMDDGTKHGGMATPFSQFNLLMISAFAAAE